MENSIVARNYADTLLALADRHGGRETIEEYGRALDEVAALLRDEPRVRGFLESPRLDAESKKQALRGALNGRVPELFLRFLLVIVDKRRERAIGQIAAAYQALVDERLGRLRAHVTLAQPADEALRQRITASLQRRYGKEVVASFEIDEELLGGFVVRIGDEILDSSLKHQLQGLRRRMLRARLRPAASTER